MVDHSELEHVLQPRNGVSMNKAKTQTREKANAKKAYVSPRLIVYGHVRSLTLSGSPKGGEGTGPGKSGSTYKVQSDRLTKQRIVKIGVHPLGIGLYLFDYKPEYREAWGNGRQFGVMADEVESVMPQAISVHPQGYKIVNYRMLGIDCSKQ